MIMVHSRKWSQFDKFQLAEFVIPEIPDYFKLANQVNQVELRAFEKRELVKEIYHTLKGKNIKYDLELFNSEPNKQRIRTYKEILENPKTGTCLDAETALDALPTILNQATGLNQTNIDTLITQIKQNLDL